jgi:hypothetical protein
MRTSHLGQAEINAVMQAVVTVVRGSSKHASTLDAPSIRMTKGTMIAGVVDAQSTIVRSLGRYAADWDAWLGHQPSRLPATALGLALRTGLARRLPRTHEVRGLLRTLSSMEPHVIDLRDNAQPDSGQHVRASSPIVSPYAVATKPAGGPTGGPSAGPAVGI